MTDTIITSATIQNVALTTEVETKTVPLTVMVNGYSTIFNQDIPRIEVNGKPVLLTVQVAEFYGTQNDRIKDNFRYQRKRFIEGEHYFELKGDDLKQFKNLVGNSHQVNKRAPRLILWTKKGVFQHAKILETDRAWDIYDLLMENYFSPKAKPIPTQAQVSFEIAKTCMEHEQRIQALERSVQLNFDTCKEAVTVVSNYVQNLSNNFDLVAKTVQELSSRLENTPDEYLPINKAAANALNKSVRRLAFMYSDRFGITLPSAVYNIQEGIRILLTGRYKIDIDEELDKLQAWLRFDYNRRIKSKTKTRETLTPSEISKLSIYAAISTRNAWTHTAQTHVDFKIQHFEELAKLKK